MEEFEDKIIIEGKQLNYYEFLGVTTASSQAEIKRAYRQKALVYHPDKNLEKKDADKLYILLKKAYEVLIDIEKKQSYDLFLKNQQAKHERVKVMDSNRKRQKEDLERRENEAKERSLAKRQEQARHEAELDSLRRRQEAEARSKETSKPKSPIQPNLHQKLRYSLEQVKLKVKPTDLMLKVQWKKKLISYNKEELESIFSTFGKLEHVVMNIEKPGRALITFYDILSVHTAMQNKERNLPLLEHFEMSWMNPGKKEPLVIQEILSIMNQLSQVNLDDKLFNNQNDNEKEVKRKRETSETRKVSKKLLTATQNLTFNEIKDMVKIKALKFDLKYFKNEEMI